MSRHKTLIKRMLMQKPTMSVDEISAALQEDDLHLSRIAISSIRAEFRHTLRFLIDEGVITAASLKYKEIKDSLIRSGARYRKQNCFPTIKVRRKSYREWHFPD
jgi:hypothetical protein